MKHILLACLALACLAVSGCGTRFMVPTSARASEPAPGKALVNVHRPSSLYGGGAEFIVWDGEQVIGNTGGNDAFQYQCAPGRHVFHAKQANVSVLVAELQAGKVYDIVVDSGPNFVPFQADYRLWLKEMPKGDKRRSEFSHWESRSQMLALDDKQAEKKSQYEQRQLKDVRTYLADFTTGSKQDKVGRINADDCR